jgi:tetratricopeptide (TPR) repeat protein
MRFFRCYLGVVAAIFVLFLFAGCSSPLQKADKLAMSDPKSAIGAYEAVMKANPGSPEAQQAHLGIAKTYYEKLNNPEKGLEVYAEVAKAYPKTEVSGAANWGIADHYFKAKDYEKAREYFAKVVEEVPGTERASNAQYAIAKCYEELKKYDEAAGLYDEFSKSHPQHSYAARSGLDAARIYEKELGDTDKAVESYKHVASDYSISSSGREAMEALTDMGVDTSDVVAAAQSEVPEPQVQPAEQVDSQFGAPRRRRATNVPRDSFGSRQSSEEQQSSSVSEDFGLDAVDLMPAGMGMDSQGTMYDAMYMMANMSLQSGQYKEAGTLYEKSLQLVGDKPWDNAANAYFGLAKSYRGIGMDDKATEMYRKAIGKDRKVIDRMIISGETAYGEEEYEEAIKSYEDALGLVPYKDNEIYYKMGLAYRKLGDANKELESFERAVALKPRFADAVQHLAEVLYYRIKDARRADLYDTEARGQGNTDYKVQKEFGDLCYKYGKIFASEADRDRQSDSCYLYAETKYKNAVRLLNNKMNADLKDVLEAGDESEAKKIVDNPSKVNIKLVSEAAASGNELALAALKQIKPLMNDYRYANARVVLVRVARGQPDKAQEYLDEIKGDDPGASESAVFHYAVGELALAQGNKAAGLAEIKKALEIDPKYKAAIDRLKELETPAAAPTAEAAG